jgi:hypothetical protein
VIARQSNYSSLTTMTIRHKLIMCAFVFQALLKVKRLKDSHDYSLMFNTPQEAPVKKPLTTSKPGGPLAGLGATETCV